MAVSMSMKKTKRKRQAGRSFWSLGQNTMKVCGSLLASVVFLAVSLVVYGVWNNNIYNAHNVPQLTSEQVLQSNLINADKLLILAHPDDDALWAGGHLMSGNWLVVCITNGRNDTRHNEFNRAINASGNAHLILEYPDKVNGSRDDWTEVMDGLRHDIDVLLSYKNWDVVATHNPDGEYGHQHHKMTSALVTESCVAHGMTDRLQYMGKYYSKAKLPAAEAGLKRLTDEQLKFKEYLLSFYKSQRSTIDKLSHMNPYEMWQSYDEYRHNGKDA